MNASASEKFTCARQNRLYIKWGAIFIGLFVLAGCAMKPAHPPAAGEDAPKRFEVPRRSYPLTPAQEEVRRQATTAVEADIDGYLGRYIESVTAEYDGTGRLAKPGTRDILSAMARGPLVISADDMRELFPQYTASPASRSIHSISVHEAVTAMAQELYERALAVDDPRGNNSVLFVAGGVASGKTTAMRTIDAVKSAEIIYDSTMRRYESAHRRVQQALQAGKLVVVVYVFTPIERSAVWLVDRAVATGRVVAADAAARSHWQAQHTFLKLIKEFDGNSAVSFLLIDNSGAKAMLVKPAEMRNRLYSEDGRFKDLDAFIEYTRELIQAELKKYKANGTLIRETEEAFDAKKSTRSCAELSTLALCADRTCASRRSSAVMVGWRQSCV
jgi:dephospho-CoA kinase